MAITLKQLANMSDEEIKNRGIDDRCCLCYCRKPETDKDYLGMCQKHYYAMIGELVEAHPVGLPIRRH